MQHYLMYINGQWLDSNIHKEVTDKYTLEPFATVAQTSPEQVDAAVESLSESFRTKKLTPRERFQILTKAGQLLLENEEDLAKTISQEAGRLIGDARFEVRRTALACEIAAEEAKRITGEMVAVDSMPGAENRICYTMRVPVGIVCCVTPFNVPLTLLVHKVAPAIAAGNVVIIKPTIQAPLTAIKFVDLLLRAGLPAEHVAIVIGGGRDVGEALLNNQAINFYSLTGSREVGEHFKKVIGLRRCSLELGSNAATIIHHDFPDIKKAAILCAQRGFANAGQICMKPQRLYVHEAVFDEFTREIVNYSKSLRVGDPADPATQVGPMISEAEVDRIHCWVQEAIDSGAELLAGGEKVGSVCYSPTVLTRVTKFMKVVSKEVFGPVVVLIPYQSIDQAITETNDSEYGLQAGIFTSNINIAMTAAKEIETGSVIINDTCFCRFDNMPYGGIKKSGAGGKEGPKYVIENMTDVRTIVITL
jgi:acyl-CoA reductase-like NAD-dependent aldehyde dehydrogenase